MRKELARYRHTELALGLAAADQRLLDILTQRPHLLHPYPNIITRLSRRSRRFRRRFAGDGELQRQLLGRAWRLGVP